MRLEAKTASKSWIYRYKSPGDQRMRQVKIGTWPEMGFPSAVVAWEALRGVREAGQDPSFERGARRVSEAQEKDGPYTVLRVVEDYLQHHIERHREPKNAGALRSRLLRGIASIACFEPSKVTRGVAFSTISALCLTPVMAKSVRQELASAWDYAYDSGQLSEQVPNWWRRVLRGKLQSKGAILDGEYKGRDKRVLTEVEVGRLVQHDFTLLSASIQDVLTLYLWTCMRGGEICALHSRMLSEVDGVLWATLPKSLTKNKNRERATDFRVPFVGRAAEVVRRRAQANPQGFLFPGRHPSGHIQQTNVQTQVHSRQPYSRTRSGWERERLQVTHWSPHDLRRTGRTLLASLGCPDEVGEAIFGHVTPGVAGVYNRHRYDAEKLRWLQKLADKLESLLQAERSDA